MTLGLAGCSEPIETPVATDPACSPVLAALPETVLGEDRTALPGGDRRNLDAAWGSPKILLVCGDPALSPTTDPCISVDGVDWVFTEERGSAFVFRTYGTDPSMLVSVPDDYGRQDAPSALVDLEAAAKKLPKNGRTCD